MQAYHGTKRRGPDNQRVRDLRADNHTAQRRTSMSDADSTPNPARQAAAEEMREAA
jgi:hypothetical protein